MVAVAVVAVPLAPALFRGAALWGAREPEPGASERTGSSFDFWRPAVGK